MTTIGRLRKSPIASLVLLRFLLPLPLLLLFIASFLPPLIHSISIDNDIIGEPDIECLDQEIRVWVKSRKYFQGRIYAKGKADDPECSKDDFASRRTKKVHFDMGLGRCGMKSLRSFDPRGMYYGITLVISFHPMFITKVDQAFHVKCFFEEANRGLTAELGVSMIPTTEVEARHGIPGCSYSIHKSSIDELDAGKAAGTAIQFAKVGDKVLHQWHCDDQMFGILINNCFVTDGVKQKVQVIDNRGCPLDPILITGIRYSADLQRAYAESQVFKFADRPGVWFFCQIQMCMKKDGMCDGVTPPSCATSATTGSPANSKFKNKKILPPGRRRGEGDEEEKGGDEGDEVAESDGQTPPNTSNEQDNGGVPRTGGGRGRGGGTATGYDEGGQEGGGKVAAPSGGNGNGRPLGGAGGGGGGDYEPGEGPTTNDYDIGTTRPEYTTTVRPPGTGKKSKQSQPGISPYGAPSPIGYDESGEESEGGNGPEAVTAFGPGYSANQVGDGPYGVGRDPPGGLSPSSPNSYIPPSPVGQQRRQELLSTEFEAEDDLRRRPSPSSSTTNTPIVRPTATTLPPAISPTTTGTERERERIGGNGNGPRKDYVDYEGDVTIPPHLTDLLANLQPEDINAQNLQKMFKDSVADRRALLQGFDLLIRKMKEEEEHKRQKTRKGNGKKEKRRKGGDEMDGQVEEEEGGEIGMTRNAGQKIDTIKVGWDSPNRMARDSPISQSSLATSAEAKANSPPELSLNQPSQWRAFRQSNSPDDPPMIAGQLLIYDLDETPPVPGQKNGFLAVEECALTRHGLTLLGIGSASLALMLLLVVGLAVFMRIRTEMARKGPGRNGGSLRANSPETSQFAASEANLDQVRRKKPPDQTEKGNRRRIFKNNFGNR